MDLRDRDSSQVPQVDQSTAQGHRLQVTGAPSTSTTGSPWSLVTQVIDTRALGIGLAQLSGAGTQVTGTSTHSIDSGTGARSSGAATGIQGTGVGPSAGPSSVRDTGHIEEHEEVAPQEVTSGRRRPKWL